MPVLDPYSPAMYVHVRVRARGSLLPSIGHSLEAGRYGRIYGEWKWIMRVGCSRIVDAREGVTEGV